MDEQMEALRAQYARLADRVTRLRVEYSETNSEMRGVLKAMDRIHAARALGRLRQTSASSSAGPTASSSDKPVERERSQPRRGRPATRIVPDGKCAACHYRKEGWPGGPRHKYDSTCDKEPKI